MPRPGGPADNRGPGVISREVIERFAELARELSAATVRFHSRVAHEVGLSNTDYKCLELASTAETALTAGQIAERAGLSTGAVTGVIDRLERAGFVRRVRDPHDRRKVLVEVSRRQISRHANKLGGLAGVLQPVLARRSPAEREVIERYAREAIVALQDAETYRTD